MSDHLQYAGDPLSRDAVRCRPADSEPAIASTWQPAYVGPPPASIRDSRNAYRVTLRRRLGGLAANLLFAAATWLDARTRRSR